jgi:hypothetical protein
VTGAPSLAEIEAACRAAWAIDTCDPTDVDEWTSDNPSRGQCGATSRVVNDLLGGEVLIAKVLRPDGSQQGYHYWNRLPDGSEVDLTHAQFVAGEVIQQPETIDRSQPYFDWAEANYGRLRARVLEILGG